MAAAVYATMARNLAVVRRRLGKPLTLADKVLLGHLDDPEHQEIEPGKSYLLLRPDRVVFQDVLGQTGLLQFMQTRRDKVAVAATIHCDHLIQARVEGGSDLRESLAENKEVYDFLRSAAAKYGLGFWGPGAGIIHQVVLENYAFPGELIIGTNSHTPNAGGLGACSVGVGGADAVEVIAGLPWEVLYPRHIAVYLTGQLNGWTAPKDVILYVAGRLTVSGGTNAIVEYIGPGARTISATGKATITNMGAELGATTSMFPADEHMARYLRATGKPGLVPLFQQHLRTARTRQGGRGRSRRNIYDRVVELDLSKLEPYIVGPHSPDRARPISQARRRGRRPEKRVHRPDLDRADRQLHQFLVRGYEPRRRCRRAGQGARHQGRRAVSGDAGLRAGARDDRARRPDAVAEGHRRHGAGQCLRTVHRPMAARGLGEVRCRTRSSPRTTAISRGATTASRRR